MVLGVSQNKGWGNLKCNVIGIYCEYEGDLYIRDFIFF